MPAESAPVDSASAEARASARAERPYFGVRTILLAGLIGFVAMLLWDAAAPVTTAIADPKAPWAWFWFSDPSTVQGVPFEESAYPVGPHVLWTIMTLP